MRIREATLKSVRIQLMRTESWLSDIDSVNFFIGAVDREIDTSGGSEDDSWSAEGIA